MKLPDNLIISTKGEELMNNMQLKGKTAVVTGSGRGLGKAIAKKLGEMGANIVLNDISSSDCLDDTAKELKALGINVIVTKGDVRNPEDTEAMIKAVSMSLEV